MSNSIPWVWVIYDGPTDFPQEIVVRPQSEREGVMFYGPHKTFGTLTEARKYCQERAKFCIPRDLRDFKSIVESWI